MFNVLFSLLSFLSPAFADDSPVNESTEVDAVESIVEKKPKNSVLIYEFEATDGSAYELSDKLSPLLLKYMSKNSDINALAISEMNNISNQTAVDYATGCPANEYAGCAYVLANASGVPYAITGSVIALDEGSQVTVVILDIASGQAALNITLDLSEGAEDVFAETVSRSVLSVIKGDISSQDEVREFEEISEIDEEEKTELDKYTKSSGSPDAVEERDIVELEKKTLNKQQILEMIDEEGSKEWDYLDMDPWEYMRYVNSGLNVSTWRKLNRGRRGQVLLRLGAGVLNGPSFGKYYGRWARSNVDLSVVDTYAWQDVANGNGVAIHGALSVGVTPWLDIGVIGGLGSGRYIIDMHAITVGQFDTAPKPYDLPNTVYYYGPEVQFVPLQVSRFKPILAANLLFWTGRTATEYVDNFPSTLPDLQATSIVQLQLAPGMEMRMSDFMDFWIRAPFTTVVYKSQTAAFQDGGGALGEENREVPPDFNPFGAGISVGLQLRLGPVGQKKEGLDIYD